MTEGSYHVPRLTSASLWSLQTSVFFFANTVQGGRNAKLRAAVWVNPAGTAAPLDAVAQPTHVIRSIAELTAVIDALLKEDGVL